METETLSINLSRSLSLSFSLFLSCHGCPSVILLVLSSVDRNDKLVERAFVRDAGTAEDLIRDAQVAQVQPPAGIVLVDPVQW